MSELKAFFTALTPGITIILIVGILFVIWDMTTKGFGWRSALGVLFLLIGGGLLARRSSQSIWLCFSAILLLLGFSLAFALHSRGRKSGSRSCQTGYFSGPTDASLLSDEDIDFYIGRVGLALQDIAPVGIVDFDGLRLEVCSEEGYIAKGLPVSISHIEEGVLFVKRLEYKMLKEKDDDPEGSFDDEQSEMVVQPLRMLTLPQRWKAEAICVLRQYTELNARTCAAA